MVFGEVCEGGRVVGLGDGECVLLPEGSNLVPSRRATVLPDEHS